MEGWSNDEQNAGIVRRFECRWGLIATLAASGHTIAVETTLVDVPSDRPAQTLASWSFDGLMQSMPAHVVEVLVDSARRIGTRATPTPDDEVLSAGDPNAAILLLENLGTLSLAEEDCRLTIDFVLERLALLVEVAPRSSAMTALVPELLTQLARLGAHDIQLAAWLRRVKSAHGTLPVEWTGMLDSIRASRA